MKQVSHQVSEVELPYVLRAFLNCCSDNAVSVMFMGQERIRIWPMQMSAWSRSAVLERDQATR